MERKSLIEPTPGFTSSAFPQCSSFAAFRLTPLYVPNKQQLRSFYVPTTQNTTTISFAWVCLCTPPLNEPGRERDRESTEPRISTRSAPRARPVLQEVGQVDGRLRFGPVERPKLILLRNGCPGHHYNKENRHNPAQGSGGFSSTQQASCSFCVPF